MGQKVNPISLRLEQTNRHFDSCWFNDYNYTDVLNRDVKIQSYINLILKQIQYSSARFFIQNLPNKIKINVFFLNPKNLRKSTSRAFQLKECTIKIGKKNRKIGTTRLELARKSCFLKNYKKQTNSKTLLVNYLLINSTNTVSLVPLSDSKKLNLRLTTNKVSRIHKGNSTKNKINLFLRYLLLKNFSLKCVVKFPVLRKKQTQSFLFSNLINLKLLDNNNKLSLTTNFLKTKIYDHEKNLQQNISKNNLQFSSISKTNYWKNPKQTQFVPENSSFMLDPLLQSDDKFITPHLHHGHSLRVEKQVNTNKLNLLNLLCSQKINSNSFFLNLINNSSEKKDYIFLSLINDQSLKTTHNNYNKVFKNGSNFTISNCPSQILEVSPPYRLGMDNGEGGKPDLYQTLENYKNNKKKVLLLHNSSYKKHIESQLSNALFSNVVVSFSRFSNEKQSAIFLAEEIIYYLEKRVPFFKIKNQILREITQNSFLKGLRITCSGRVGGRSKKAQRSKVQVIKYGQTSLHVFSSKIDFASKHAHTAFGLLGIKVWICYN